VHGHVSVTLSCHAKAGLIKQDQDRHLMHTKVLIERVQRPPIGIVCFDGQVLRGDWTSFPHLSTISMHFTHHSTLHLQSWAHTTCHLSQMQKRCRMHYRCPAV